MYEVAIAYDKRGNSSWEVLHITKDENDKYQTSVVYSSASVENARRVKESKQLEASLKKEKSA